MPLNKLMGLVGTEAKKIDCFFIRTVPRDITHAISRQSGAILKIKVVAAA